MAQKYIMFLLLAVTSASVPISCFPSKENGKYLNEKEISQNKINAHEESKEDNQGFSCKEIDFALYYIESVLESHIYYITNIPKEEIRPPLIWVMTERIPFNTITYNDDDTDSSIVMQNLCVTRQRVPFREANYLLFASDIIDNQLLVVLVNNRDSWLNISGPTMYETWSKMNGGMSYLFKFNKHGCIQDVKKKYVFRE